MGDFEGEVDVIFGFGLEIFLIWFKVFGWEFIYWLCRSGIVGGIVSIFLGVVGEDFEG